MGVVFNPFTGTFDFTGSSTGGSTSPGGSDTQVQFNDGGSFGGDAGLTFNKTTNVLTAGGLVADTHHFLNVDGSVIFNETGASVDIRMEGDTNANLFFLDGSADKIGFGTSTPAERLNVIGNFQVDDATTPTKGYRFRTSGSALDLDAAAANLLLSTYTGVGFTGTQRQYIEFGAEFEFEKHYKKTIWDSSGDMFVIDKDAADGFVWNEAGADKNARFEGDTDTELLFLDASTDRIGVSTTTPAVTFDVAGAFRAGVVALSDGATPALNAALGNTFTLTAAGDRTIAAPSNPVNGQKIVILHTASAANRTLSLTTGAGGFSFGTDITALTATTSGLTDYIGAIYNSTSNRWHVIAYVKGYNT